VAVVVGNQFSRYNFTLSLGVMHSCSLWDMQIRKYIRIMKTQWKERNAHAEEKHELERKLLMQRKFLKPKEKHKPKGKP